MCRSIETLRPPFVDEADEADAAATRELLDRLEIRGIPSAGSRAG
jgi:hypothetical protein